MRDIVSFLEFGDGGAGGGVVFIVDFDDDEGGVGGFRDRLEMLGRGGVADPGDDGVVWPGEVGC